MTIENSPERNTTAYPKIHHIICDNLGNFQGKKTGNLRVDFTRRCTIWKYISRVQSKPFPRTGGWCIKYLIHGFVMLACWNWKGITNLWTGTLLVEVFNLFLELRFRAQLWWLAKLFKTVSCSKEFFKTIPVKVTAVAGLCHRISLLYLISVTIPQGYDNV